MHTGDGNRGGASVAMMTDAGQSPKETQARDTGISESQTTPKEKEEASPINASPTASNSDRNFNQNSTLKNPGQIEGGMADASNDNPGRKAKNNIGSEAGESSIAKTKDSSKTSKASGPMAPDKLQQPAAKSSSASDTESSKSASSLASEGKSGLGIRAIAPAPATNTPLPLAAAPQKTSIVAASPSAVPSSGQSTGSGSGTKKTGTSLRRGKWTTEEEAYVARVIQDFNSGFLNAPAGTTLRSYLSEKLQCDPMRITKKFTGESCIGKRVFHPAVRSAGNAGAIDKAQAELEALEHRWRRRLEVQQRESARKAAASAAAATGGRNHGFVTHGMSSPLVPGGHASNGPNSKQNGVAQTATWLDRASNILTGSSTQSAQLSSAATTSQQKFTLTPDQIQALQSLPKEEVEMQMKEVERLIHEGPIIQQTTAGLGSAPDQSAENDEEHHVVPSMIVAHGIASPTDGQQTTPEPADKRMRTGAEDAEALVGFLTAVRASTAAGTDSLSG